MARSLSLALYLLVAARGESAATRWPDRPDGTLVWLRAGPDEPAAALAQVARRAARERKDLRFLLTSDDRADIPQGDLPPGTLTDAAPPETLADVRSFLAHWHPEAIVLVGAALPVALVVEAGAQGIPMIAVNLRPVEGFGPRASWMRAVQRSVLPRLARIMAEDSDTAGALAVIARGAVTVDVTGRVEETPEPLGYNEAERESLSTLLRTRPVWLALGCAHDEDEAVTAAHAQAMRLAHRMLLILVPDDPSRVPAIEARFVAEGWTVALRSREEEPGPEVEVLIADGETELGLWYRLAPVTFMGGTLGGARAGRSPMEPAALGSAIICGAAQAGHAAAYRRLAEARALRLVRSAPALAEAVGDLIAPDRAAFLAHNAWIASSGGAEVADRVAEAIAASLDARAAEAGQG